MIKKETDVYIICHDKPIYGKLLFEAVTLVLLTNFKLLHHYSILAYMSVKYDLINI